VATTDTHVPIGFGGGIAGGAHQLALRRESGTPEVLIGLLGPTANPSVFSLSGLFDADVSTAGNVGQIEPPGQPTSLATVPWGDTLASVIGTPYGIYNLASMDVSMNTLTEIDPLRLEMAAMGQLLQAGDPRYGGLLTPCLGASDPPRAAWLVSVPNGNETGDWMIRVAELEAHVAGAW
jgi:hypothetical protein